MSTEYYSNMFSDETVDENQIDIDAQREAENIEDGIYEINQNQVEEIKFTEDLGTDDPLQIYLKDLRKIRLLDADEEREVAKRIANGDEEARKELATANLRLVVFIANKYVGSGLGKADLIQEGNIGLMKAIDHFDYTKGFRFSTYAAYWIRQSILKAISDTSRTIRIPIHMVQRLKRYNDTITQLEAQMMRKPTIEEVADKMGESVKKLMELEKLPGDTVSLESPIKQDEEGRLIDFVFDPSDSEFDKRTENNAISEHIREMLKILSPEEEVIIIMRFGLDGSYSHTLYEIADEMCMDRNKVQRVEQRALQKLRDSEFKEVLMEYWK